MSSELADNLFTFADAILPPDFLSDSDPTLPRADVAQAFRGGTSVDGDRLPAGAGFCRRRAGHKHLSIWHGVSQGSASVIGQPNNIEWTGIRSRAEQARDMVPARRSHA